MVFYNLWKIALHQIYEASGFFLSVNLENNILCHKTAKLMAIWLLKISWSVDVYGGLKEKNWNESSFDLYLHSWLKQNVYLQFVFS